jgi:hypothetical protein
MFTPRVVERITLTLPGRCGLFPSAGRLPYCLLRALVAMVMLSTTCLAQLDTSRELYVAQIVMQFELPSVIIQESFTISYGSTTKLCAKVDPIGALSNVTFDSDPNNVLYISVSALPPNQPCQEIPQGNVELTVTSNADPNPNKGLCSARGNIKVHSALTGKPIMNQGIPVQSLGTVLLPVFEEAQIIPPPSFTYQAPDKIFTLNPMTCSQFNEYDSDWPIYSPAYGGETIFGLNIKTNSAQQADFTNVIVLEKFGSSKIIVPPQSLCRWAEFPPAPPDPSMQRIHVGKISQNQIEDVMGFCPFKKPEQYGYYWTCWGARIYRIQELTAGVCPLKSNYFSQGFTSNGGWVTFRSDASEYREIPPEQQ